MGMYHPWGMYGPWWVFAPFSFFFGLVQLALLVLGLLAGARILTRLGFNGWWVLLGLVPIANVIGLWMLSQADWPGLPDGRSARTAPADS
ncbi:MAG: hypothetical protein ACXU82_10380 [Caulobacteraceae bacterium]